MLTMTLEDSPSSTSAGSRPRGSAPCAYVNVSTVVASAAGSSAAGSSSDSPAQPARAETTSARASMSERIRADLFMLHPSFRDRSCAGIRPSLTCGGFRKCNAGARCAICRVLCTAWPGCARSRSVTPGRFAYLLSSPVRLVRPGRSGTPGAFRISAKSSEVGGASRGRRAAPLRPGFSAVRGWGIRECGASAPLARHTYVRDRGDSA